jgi:hypothetical protein
VEREYPDTQIVATSGHLRRVILHGVVFSTTSLAVRLLLAEILRGNVLTETEEVAFQAAREVGAVGTRSEARKRLDQDDKLRSYTISEYSTVSDRFGQSVGYYLRVCGPTGVRGDPRGSRMGRGGVVSRTITSAGDVSLPTTAGEI